MKHLVIDAGAFIKGVQLQNIAEEYWTTQDVVDEIRDKKSRNFMEKLPFTVNIKVPSEHAMKAVISFSKKTGDFSFLSLPDLRVLALTYMLENQENGVAHLRVEPEDKKMVVKGAGKHQTKLANVNAPCAYFNTPDGCRFSDKECRYLHLKNELEEQVEALGIGGNEIDTVVEPMVEPAVEEVGSSPIHLKNAVEGCAENAVEKVSVRHNNERIGSRILGRGGSLSYTVEGDDGGDWIGIDNCEQYMSSPFGSGVTKEKDEEKRTVGCITTDYSMQNVMLQMGLQLLSTDGMVIRNVKQWILRCSACFQIVSQMDRKFCPRCGNHGLDRISCSIDSKTGELKLYTRQNRPTRLQGTKFSIPKSRGGRTGDLLLREDQLMVGMWNQRQRRSSKKVDCAFGEHLAKDVGVSTIRGSDLTVGFGRRNPNAQKGRERRGKKKKGSGKKG